MKLSRVRIEQFRRFRQPVELTGLDHGLNLFTGPNEAGKSTVVAAIRAAFFERHRSSSVDDFRPDGDSAASPTVEVDFVLGDVQHRLTKTFLSRKRCELQAGPLRLDGAAAEDHLAAALGFEHAGRGASGAEHWGIPGLLWIQQGAGHEIAKPVSHAGDHLRHALNASLGEVASNQGDDVLHGVEVARNELLTPSTGKPTGAYGDALRAEATLVAQHDAMTIELSQYRQKVDTMAALRREHAADAAEPPWVAFRQQEQTARAREESVRGIKTTLEASLRRRAELEAQASLLRTQLEGFDTQSTEAAARATQLASAVRAVADANDALQRWQHAATDASRRCELTRRALAEARHGDAHRAALRALAAAEAEETAAQAALQRAEAEQAAVDAAALAVQAHALPVGALASLRERQRERHELQIRQATAATGLRFSLNDGHAIRIGDDTTPATGQGERRLLDVTVIDIPEVGRLEIVPGGADLAAWRARASALADDQAQLLERLGLASLEAAEARQQAHDRHTADLRAATATLKALAPQGVDALRASHRLRTARVTDLMQALAALPSREPAAADVSSMSEPAPAPMPLSVSEAEVADAAARQSLAETDTARSRAELAAGNAQTRAEAARREHGAAQALLEAPERQGRIGAARQALTDTLAERHALDTRIDTLAEEVREARPDILAQDVERFRRSAEQHEKRHGERRDMLLRLDVELQAAGAQGLDERHAELTRDLAQLRRRIAEWRRRADALDHLLTLLREKRRALTRRLQAPLQKHLQRYVTLLFPHATLEIDENLSPGPLTRRGNAGAESGHFGTLSFGAREQMALISRLAYADLLKAAGRPTLLILDDALVHSDDERLGAMKRVLFDAASRHQILLFTCHPSRWRDMGVTARSLPGAVDAMGT